MDRKQYQDRAMECLLVAAEIRDPVERLKMIEVARQYMLLDVLLAAQVSPAIDPNNT
jgi:hypothetical protein